MKEKTKSILELLIFLTLFCLISYFVQQNLDFFKQYIEYGFKGIIFYFLIVIFCSVVAPISSAPLIPLLSGIYGWFFAGIITVFAWTLGAAVIFFISRKFGVKIISKLVSLEKIYKLEKKVAGKQEFWSVVALRLVFHVDLLSYFLGLFSKISFPKFILATFIGVTPLAMTLAYAGSVSFKMQIVIFIFVVLVIFIVLLIKEIKNSKTSSHKSLKR